MPKKPVTFKGIKLNLLRPQNEPEKIASKLFQFSLSFGRYILIIVEMIVLAAFITRFKLDADIAALREPIENQLNYIKSQNKQEQQIRQLQSQVTTVKDLKNTNPDYGGILANVAKEVPSGVTMSNLTLDKGAGSVNLKIQARAISNTDVNNFLLGLKQNPTFSAVTLGSIALEKENIVFSVSAVASFQVPGEQQL